MLVKCTPSAHRRGRHCLPNKQSANYQTTRLHLQQPNLLDWMKHFLFGKIPLLILLIFSIQNVSFGQCTASDFPTAKCKGNPSSPALSIALDETGTATISVSDIDDGSFDANPDCGISLALSQNTFDCSDVGDVAITLIVTNTYTDNNGDNPNQNTCNTSITIMDNLSPIITCPGEVTVNCPDPTTPPDTGVATATDNCDLDIAPTTGPNVLPAGYMGPINTFYYYSDDSNPTGNPGECDVITRTWRVYDENENFAECDQIINLNDDEAPIFDFDQATAGNQETGPADVTVDCASIPNAPTINTAGAELTASDNCPSAGTNITIVFTEDFSTLTSDANQDACYTLTRTWTATDDCGNSTSTSQVITVEDTTAPTLDDVADETYMTATGTCTATVSYTYGGAIADDCFEPNLSPNPNVPLVLTYDVRDDNGDEVTGFSGSGHTITNVELGVGDYTFNFYATDPCGNVGQETVNVTVNDDEDPTLVCTMNIDVEINGPTSIADLVDPFVTATDNCTAEEDIVFAFECTGGGSGGTAPACTMLDCTDVGNTVIVEVIATDESNRDASCFIAIDVLDGAPQCVANPIPVMLDATGNYMLDAQDEMDINGSFDDCGGTVTLVSITPNTFDCTDAAMSNGEVTITLVVEDDATPANQSSCTGTVTVQDAEAPMAECQDAPATLDADGNPMYSQPYDYVVSTMGTYNPVAGTGTSVTLANDEVSSALAIGFDFQYFGTTYTEFYISSNGFITFSNSGATGMNPQTLPDVTNPNNVIAFAWANLNPAASGTIDYLTVGTAPNRQLVVNFQNVPTNTGGGLVTTQLVLSEGSDLIEIHTDELTAGGNNFTKGIENATGMIGYPEMGVNNQVPADQNDTYVSFTPMEGQIFDNGSTDNCGDVSFSLNVDLADYECIEIPLLYTIRSSNQRYRRRNLSDNSNVIIADIPSMGTITEMDYDADADIAIMFSNDGTDNFLTQFDPITGDTIGDQIAASIGGATTIEAAEVIDGVWYISLSNGDFGTINIADGNITITNSLGVTFTGLAHDGTDFYAVDATGNLHELDLVLTPSVTVSITTTNPVAGADDFDGFEFGPTGNFIAKGTVGGNSRLFVLDVNTPAVASMSNMVNTVTGLLTHTHAPAVELTVTDNSGNTDMCDAHVILEDDINPVANCQDITVSLDVNGDAEIEATDLDDGSTDNCSVERYRVDISTFDCSDVGTVAVELEVMDRSGNTDTETCTVTIVDDIAPNLNCPSTVQIPLNQNGDGILNTNTATAQDNCGTATITYSQSTFDCSDVIPSPFSVTATATDGTNSISCSFQVTVVDNMNPILTCPADVTIDCLAAKDAPGVVPMATATDNCSNPTVTQATPDVELTEAEVIALDPNACRGFVRTFSAVDASGNSATDCSFNILLIDMVDPTLDSDPFDPADPSATAGVGGTLQEISCENLPANDEMVPVFVDNDGDAICEVEITAEYIIAANTTGCPYVRTRNYRATDACGNVFDYAQQFRVIDNVDPEFDAGVVNTVVVSTDNNQCFASDVSQLDFTGLASDNCTSFADLTKGFVVTENGVTGTVHSSSTSLDASNFNYSPGEYTVTYTVADPCGNDEVHTVAFTVEDNDIPVVDCKAFKNITLDNNGQANLNPADFDDGGTADPCGFSLSLSPAILNCDNIDGANLPTPVPVALIATDPSGNMNSCTTTVNLSFPTPTVNCPNNLTVNCADEDYEDFAITDVPEIDVPCSSFITSFLNPAPTDDIVDSNISGICKEVTRTFTITVTDQDANPIFNSTCVQTINLIDNDDPTFDSTPAGTTIACENELPGPDQVTASDAGSCLGGVPEVTTSDDLTNSCVQITRTYTATDECGNTETFTQTFPVVNDDPKVDFSTASPFDFDNDAGDCSREVNIDFSQYITDCSDYSDLIITITDQNSGDIYIENDRDINGDLITSNDFNGSTFDVGTYDFDVFVTDPCYNSTTGEGSEMGTFTMYIQDNQAPSLSCDQTQIVNIDQSGVLNLSDVFDSATDNCGNVTAVYFEQNNGQTITYTADDAGNTYNVVINAEDDAIEQSTGASDINTGTCTVVVTVIGNQITLLAAGNNSPIIASSTSGGELVNVPVTVEEFDFIEGFSFTYNLSYPGTDVIAEFQEFTPAEFIAFSNVNPILTDNGNLFVSYSSDLDQISITYAVNTAPGTISIGTGTLFEVVTRITNLAMAGDVVDLNIDGSAIPLEIVQNTGSGSNTIVNPTLIAGEIEVTDPPMMINLSGNVMNDENEPIEGVEMQFSNASSDLTNSSGNYIQQITQGANVTVDPDFNPSINVFSRVNLFDANAIQSHAGGSPLLPDLQDWIAADVNGSGTITISDVVRINQILIGLQTQYPSGVDSWEFIPTSDILTQPTQHFVVPTHTETRTYSSTDTQNDITQGDFLALEMGNVTPAGDQALNQMVANPSVAMEAAVRDNNVMTLTTRDQAIRKGQIVPIAFHATNFNDLIGFALDMKFETSALKFKDVLTGDLPDFGVNNFNINEVENGRLPMIWLAQNVTSLTEKEIIFTLLFEAQTDLPSLENIMELSFEKMPTYAAGANEEVIMVDLNFEYGIDNNLEGGFSLFQNRPNPFRNETIIGFNLPKATIATLRITDISGKTIELIENNYQAGYHEIEVKNLDATGVLFYELKTPEYQLTKRMILLDNQ